MPDENPQSLGVVTFNLRFPGQYYDPETALHYNYFRDYDPNTGRYIERALLHKWKVGQKIPNGINA